LSNIFSLIEPLFGSADGKFRKIKVKVKDKKYKVTHRAGYIAEQKKANGRVESLDSGLGQTYLLLPLSSGSASLV